MLHLLVEPQFFGHLHNAAIDSSTHKAALPQVVKEVTVLPFLPLNQRRQQQESSAGFQPGNAVNDLFRRLSRDRATAFGAMTLADSREQHAEIVEDFGDRPDG